MEKAYKSIRVLRQDFQGFSSQRSHQLITVSSAAELSRVLRHVTARVECLAS